MSHPGKLGDVISLAKKPGCYSPGVLQGQFWRNSLEILSPSAFEPAGHTQPFSTVRERLAKDIGGRFTTHVQLFPENEAPPQVCIAVESLSHAIPWTVALQAPMSMGFPRQEYWCGLPCLPPGIFLTQGANVQLHFLCLFHSRQIVYALSHVETVNFGGELYRKPKCCRMSGGGVP